MNNEQLNESIAFLQRAENLKNTLRSGYTSNGRPESTAEHTWRLCLLVMVFSRHFAGADENRLLRLAIVHDLGEAVSGDIPAVAQSVGDDKLSTERKGMAELCAGLPDAVQAEFMALWDEYSAAATPEAKIIKGLDKLETIMQHNQGKNPAGFDYDFNLSYGREYTSALPLLEQIREALDTTTRERSMGKAN